MSSFEHIYKILEKNLVYPKKAMNKFEAYRKITYYVLMK